jgi:hypothetical protein
MTGFHVTTPAKLQRYHETGVILPPVRFWRTRETAERWAQRVGRSVILRCEIGEAYPLPDHQPRGMAWWTPWMVREWEEESR